MSSWLGFPDDDDNSHTPETNDSKKLVGVRIGSLSESRGRRGKEVSNKRQQQQPQEQQPQEQQLEKQQQQQQQNAHEQQVLNALPEGAALSPNPIEVMSAPENEVVTNSDGGGEVDEAEGVSRQKSSLEKFKEQQKEIEAENAKRRTILKQAIDNRKKKTVEEQQKLVHIQRELEALDSGLSSDVKLLRNKIEEASRVYLEARKRYERSEQEFIRAKLHLHKSTEVKDQLTEHLYTIIAENEGRKGRKLEELMKSLGMREGIRGAHGEPRDERGN